MGEREMQQRGRQVVPGAHLAANIDIEQHRFSGCVLWQAHELTDNLLAQLVLVLTERAVTAVELGHAGRSGKPVVVGHAETVRRRAPRSPEQRELTSVKGNLAARTS